MGEFLAKFLEMFVDKNNKISARFILLIIVAAIITPFTIDYFYGNNRTLQKVEIIKQLAQIDVGQIKDQRLIHSYNELIDQISGDNQIVSQSLTQTKSANILDYFTEHNFYKFIAGSSIWILMIIFVFTAKYDTIKSRISAIFIVLLFSIIFGIIGVAIPDFNPITVNYILYPVVQLSIIIAIALNMNKKKS